MFISFDPLSEILPIEMFKKYINYEEVLLNAENSIHISKSLISPETQ